MVEQMIQQEKTVIEIVTIETPQKIIFENSTFLLAAAASLIRLICFRSRRFSAVSSWIPVLRICSGFYRFQCFASVMVSPP